MFSLGFLKKYTKIELFGREKSYRMYQLIIKKKENKSPLAYLIALGIPAYSALSLATKLVSDACRIIDTLIQTIKLREYAGGNIQTLVVDTVEYGRSILGVLIGALVALFSPVYAAKTFLTIAADTKSFLTPIEGARLYAMADGLHTFFVKYNIDYRICSGTALGAYREQGIIRNDDDIDLMLHPDSVDKFKDLITNGTLSKETGLSIEVQPVTGGWQCFYSDTPKGAPNTPMERIGKPFVDIFPGVVKTFGKQCVITYGKKEMYLQSKGDYFTEKEWGDRPTLYRFGPTRLFGIGSNNTMRNYLQRCYGSSALNYKTRLYPHEVYSTVYGNPLRAYILFQYSAPRYMRDVDPKPLDFELELYNTKRALAI